MIAVIVLAYNQVDLLRHCVERVLLRTSEATTEIVIWDNASTDGTAAYLETLTDPRIRVIQHPENIGLNALARVLPDTTAEYVITIDQDVIEAPDRWDATLLDGFRKLPDIGFLATNQVDDINSHCAWIMHHRDQHLYTSHEVNGVRILEGPVGGWCAMTSRHLLDQVGGYPQDHRHVYFHYDDAYIGTIGRLGFRPAILEDLSVFHTSGPYYGKSFAEKGEYYASRERIQNRKDAIKRVLLRIPLVRPLNERRGWFHPPAPARRPLRRGDHHPDRAEGSRLGALVAEHTTPRARGTSGLTHFMMSVLQRHFSSPSAPPQPC